MARQDKYLDQQMLADEIDKYIKDTAKRHSLPGMMNLTVKEETYGFLPTAFRAFTIDSNSINERSTPSEISFNATGTVRFREEVSGISQDQDVTFRGIATIDYNGRFYVKNVEINWMYPLYPTTLKDPTK